MPYCEKDYQAQFGVKCAYCNRFISGKVLQAGDNHHFHPTCARCTKCGDPFGDGEEMYLQGEFQKGIGLEEVRKGEPELSKEKGLDWMETRKKIEVLEGRQMEMGRGRGERED